MAKRKNPAAVALGRKGGKVSGIRKGFAAITPDKLAELQARALAKRKASSSAQRQDQSLKVHGDPPLDTPKKAPAKKKEK